MDHGKSYVTVDTHGVRRISDTMISLDSVVIAFQQGDSPEEIQRNFPTLTLEQVYGAIAHYLANRDDVDDYLRRQRAEWERKRAEHERVPDAALERLRKLRAGQPGPVR